MNINFLIFASTWRCFIFNGSDVTVQIFKKNTNYFTYFNWQHNFQYKGKHLLRASVQRNIITINWLHLNKV